MRHRVQGVVRSDSETAAGFFRPRDFAGVFTVCLKSTSPVNSAVNSQPITEPIPFSTCKLLNCRSISLVLEIGKISAVVDNCFFVPIQHIVEKWF